MRILFVSYMHPAVAPGGAQQVAYELFSAAVRAGHDATLLAALEVEHEGLYGKPGAPIVPHHGQPNEFFFFPQGYNFSLLSLTDHRTVHLFQEFVASVNPEVIHFHHYHRIGVETIVAARRVAPAARISLTFHEMMAICMADGQMLKRETRALCWEAKPLACSQCFPENRPEYFTLRQLKIMSGLEVCDDYIFPSEFLADRYIGWGLDENKCAIIQNGQDRPLFSGSIAQHSTNVNRFGFFGQFVDNKGIDVIVDALLILAREKLVPDCGIRVEINGGNKHYASRDYISGLEAKVEALRKIGANITISERGLYTRDSLPERMMAVDWVIVPSTWWEVFGLVVSEAWMFGRPVIASDIGGLSERVLDGTNGIKFPARDARKLAEIIQRVVGDVPAWANLNRGVDQPHSAQSALDAHMELWRENRPIAFPSETSLRIQM